MKGRVAKQMDAAFDFLSLMLQSNSDPEMFSLFLAFKNAIGFWSLMSKIITAICFTSYSEGRIIS